MNHFKAVTDTYLQTYLNKTHFNLEKLTVKECVLFIDNASVIWWTDPGEIADDFVLINAEV